MKFTTEMEWLQKFGNPTADKIMEHLANYAILLEDVKDYANYYGLTVKDIQDRIRAQGISEEEAFLRLQKAATELKVNLSSSQRLREQNDVRQAVVYLMMKYTRITTTKLAKYMKRHHSSILHMRKKAEDLKGYDFNFAELLNKLEKVLLQGIAEPEPMLVNYTSTNGYMTVKEASEELNCTTSGIYHRVNRQVLNATFINNRKYICAHSVGKLKARLRGRSKVQGGLKHY